MEYGQSNWNEIIKSDIRAWGHARRAGNLPNPLPQYNSNYYSLENVPYGANQQIQDFENNLINGMEASNINNEVGNAGGSVNGVAGGTSKLYFTLLDQLNAASANNANLNNIYGNVQNFSIFYQTSSFTPSTDPMMLSTTNIEGHMINVTVANQGGVSFTANEANEGSFLGKTFSEWYDATGKIMAGETVPVILSTLSRIERVARIGTGISYPIAGIGLVMDFKAALKGDITWTKFAINQTASAVGLLGGVEGAIASGIYFGVDAFYPSGWNGFGNDISNFGNEIYNKTIQGINQYNSGFSGW